MVFGINLVLFWAFFGSSAGHGPLTPLTIMGSPMTFFGALHAFVGCPAFFGTVGAVWNSKFALRVALGVHLAGIAATAVLRPDNFDLVRLGPAPDLLLVLLWPLAGYLVGLAILVERCFWFPAEDQT